MIETLKTLETIKENLESKKNHISKAVAESKTEVEQSFYIGKLIGVDNCIVELELAISELDEHISDMLEEMEADRYAML